MIGRRAAVGLSLLCALLFCAFAAQSASAAKSTNTTAVTCVPSEKGGFNDAHCDIPNAGGTGKFTHEAIPLNETKTVNATNQKVTNETKEHEAVRLNGSIGLTKVEISCTTLETDTSNSFVHNVESESKHTMTGNGTAVISECTVLKPAKCIIKGPIRADANFSGAEKLGAAENEMGVEFVGANAEETFAEVTFEGAECALKGQTYKVKGSMIGTSGPGTESSQTNKWSGATIVFTAKKEMEKLKLGSGTAEVSTIVTPTGTGGGANPIPITTTT